MLYSHADENQKVESKRWSQRVLPFLFSLCFLSLCAWLKSPLGEPCSCCQATRLPGSRALMNSHTGLEVAPANTLNTGTDRRTNTRMCANTCQSVACTQPEQTGHKCTQWSCVWDSFLTTAQAQAKAQT